MDMLRPSQSIKVLYYHCNLIILIKFKIKIVLELGKKLSRMQNYKKNIGLGCN